MGAGFGVRSVGRVIDDAVSMYRAHFKTYAVAALWIIFPAMLIEVALSGIYTSMYTGTLLSTVAPSEEELASFFGTMMLSYAALFVGMIVAGLAQSYYAASTYASAETMLFGQKRTPAEFLKAGKARWGAYLLAIILVGMIVYGISSVVYMFGAFVICLLPFTMIGAIVGGMWLWGILSMVGPTVVIERAPIGLAFRRSRALVRGNEWRTVGFLLMMALINSVLQQAISSLSLVPYVVEIIRNPEAVWAMSGFGAPGMVWLTVVTGTINAIALSITVPLTGIATYSYYLDLRSRTEGIDLVMRARALRGAA